MDLITKTNTYVNTLKDKFNEVEHLDIMTKLLFIADSIKQNKTGGFLTTTSNKLLKFCPQISKSTNLEQIN